jgi:hypothetical protein
MNSFTTLVMVGLDEISASVDNIRRALDKQAPDGDGHSCRYHAIFPAVDYAPPPVVYINEAIILCVDYRLDLVRRLAAFLFRPYSR